MSKSVFVFGTCRTDYLFLSENYHKLSGSMNTFSVKEVLQVLELIRHGTSAVLYPLALPESLQRNKGSEFIHSQLNSADVILIEISSLKYITDRNGTVYNWISHCYFYPGVGTENSMTRQQLEVDLLQIRHFFDKPVIFQSHLLNPRCPARVRRNREIINAAGSKCPKALVPSVLFDNIDPKIYSSDINHLNEQGRLSMLRYFEELNGYNSK